MTDDREQQELIELIERLAAGEPVAPADGSGEEQERLLEIASELIAARPEPAAGFEESLRARLQAEAEAGVSTADETSTVGGKTDGGHRWLPGWLTLPRLAAATAVLVMVLGIAGLTGAIIRGGYQGDTAAVSTTEADSNAVSSEFRTMEDAAGAEPGSTGATGATGAFPGDAGVAAPATGGNTTLPPLPQADKVILTADYSIDLAPGEFDERYASLAAIATRYGGYVLSADSQTGADGLKHGSFTIRVANVDDNFNRAQADIDGLGTVTSKKQSGQDVSEEYVDLESRLRNAQAQEAQMLALLQKAQSVDEILMIQSRLSEIQAEIEQLKGRISYMDTRTGYATIAVDMREKADGGGEPESGGTDWGFVESLRYAGWLAVQTVNFVIMALGVIIPVALMAAALYLAASWLVRRRAGKKAS